MLFRRVQPKLQQLQHVRPLCHKRIWTTLPQWRHGYRGWSSKMRKFVSYSYSLNISTPELLVSQITLEIDYSVEPAPVLLKRRPYHRALGPQQSIDNDSNHSGERETRRKSWSLISQVRPVPHPGWLLDFLLQPPVLCPLQQRGVRVSSSWDWRYGSTVDYGISIDFSLPLHHLPHPHLCFPMEVWRVVNQWIEEEDWLILCNKCSWLESNRAAPLVLLL